MKAFCQFIHVNTAQFQLPLLCTLYPSTAEAYFSILTSKRETDSLTYIVLDLLFFLSVRRFTIFTTFTILTQ